MFTPIGTRIDVSLHSGWVYGKTMNIDIYMAPKDKYNVEGLCGTFDLTTSNDFKHSDGSISVFDRYPNKFTGSWRYDILQSAPES